MVETGVNDMKRAIGFLSILEAAGADVRRHMNISNFGERQLCCERLQRRKAKRMKSRSDRKWAFLRDALIAASVLAVVGCNSAPSKTEKNISQQKNAATATNNAPDIDLNCVINHIQSPPESFHYSFKDESSNSWQEEADVTPQTIDGSFTNNFVPGPQAFHGSPREVSSNLMAIGRLASAFALVRNSPAVLREGTEKVNGYDTVKYSIDTARGTATEQGLYSATLGKGGFEKGTVWTITEGCPVKLVLDEELHSKDGSVTGKAHYEEAMVRK